MKSLKLSSIVSIISLAFFVIGCSNAVPTSPASNSKPSTSTQSAETDGPGERNDGPRSHPRGKGDDIGDRFLFLESNGTETMEGKTHTGEVLVETTPDDVSVTATRVRLPANVDGPIRIDIEPRTFLQKVGQQMKFVLIHRDTRNGTEEVINQLRPTYTCSCEMLAESAEGPLDEALPQDCLREGDNGRKEMIPHSHYRRKSAVGTTTQGSDTHIPDHCQFDSHERGGFKIEVDNTYDQRWGQRYPYHGIGAWVRHAFDNVHIQSSRNRIEAEYDIASEGPSGWGDTTYRLDGDDFGEEDEWLIHPLPIDDAWGDIDGTFEYELTVTCGARECPGS